ncbi:hypothetical protein VP01_9256g1 [Puccinia sorghi]|uniref:Tet-like 2OG-Fe(II) oxygenase domain-containing protein n=1 Tax=Puccinia sorghi TaxID=27349 RepID=A0A0L6U9A3_9BASI|nr:hypothetical protein VP01_9256g1 [Puccinia sorghi]
MCSLSEGEQSSAKCQKERQLNASLDLSGIAHLPVKFYPLSQNLIAQTAYQNPNQSNAPQDSRKMYSLGWLKGYEEASKIGIKGIEAKVERIRMDIASYKAMFLNKTPSLANGSNWFPVLYFMKRS